MAVFQPPLLTSNGTVLTTTPVTNTSTEICAANPDRKSFMIFNDGGNVVFISLGQTATNSTASFSMSPNSSMIFTAAVAYVGVINAIRNSGSGSVTVTELI